jgi:NarL family two-component system response regulator LiaR
MTSQPLRIAIANDFDIVVAGIAAVLEPYGDRIELIELDSSRTVVSKVDLVLYDTFSQLQIDAVDLDQVVRDPEARIVVFSWATDTAVVRRSLAAGAAGYLTKAITAPDLVAALERIHAGEQVLSLGEVSAAAGEVLGRWPGDKHGLSPRESEILALICQGLTNEDLAERTFITMNTVKSHIRSIYRKIDVSTRSQAVRWGLEHGFTPDHTRKVAPGAATPT